MNYEETPASQDLEAPEVDLSPESAAEDLAQAQGLSELDREILDFEGMVWKKTALKERAISSELGITPIQYYQRLVALSRLDQAYEYAPAVIRKLREAYVQRTSRKLL